MDPGASFDTSGTPGGASIVEMQEFKICFDYFVLVVPPGGFLTSMKMLPNVSFIIKVIKKSVFVSTNSHNFIFSRENHFLKE